MKLPVIPHPFVIGRKKRFLVSSGYTGFVFHECEGFSFQYSKLLDRKKMIKPSAQVKLMDNIKKLGETFDCLLTFTLFDISCKYMSLHVCNTTSLILLAVQYTFGNKFEHKRKCTHIKSENYH